jgi:hypothetical protein
VFVWFVPPLQRGRAGAQISGDDQRGVISALIRGPAPESLVDIACLVLLGRRSEEFVRGRYAKVASGFRSA